MKKLAVVLMAMVLGLSLTACSGSPAGDGETGWDWQSEPAAEKTGETINVYNWGEYIDKDEVNVLAAFTHLTGIEVNYSTYTENESMYAMLSAGGAEYDVICPSDYMVGKMRQENMLAKLNFDNIPNFQYIDESLRKPNYDPTGEYSVPYTWGTVGIFYNTKYVDEEDLKDGWGLLWNEQYKGKIFMFDNSRDAFGIALNKLGYSMNTTDKKEIEAAYQELAKQKPLLQQYVMDQVYDKMINEEGYIAPYYAGDGIIMMDEEEGNPDIAYFVPQTGTNRFVDALCIPATSKHKEAAEAFINFMCRTEVAKANAEYIGYATPHTEARKLLDPEVGENPAFYPAQEILDKTEMFLTLPDEANQYMEELWLKLKK